jgi:hypothetical protein
MTVGDNVTVTMSEVGMRWYFSQSQLVFQWRLLKDIVRVRRNSSRHVTDLPYEFDSGLVPMLEQTLALEPGLATFAVCESLAVATSGEEPC